MEFGKLSDLSRLNSLAFELPPLEKRSQLFLQSLGGNDSFAFLSGCPIWAHQEWLGKVYPESARRSEFLRLYSKQFRTVEVNSLFYTLPHAEVIEDWTKSVSAGFKFCPKVYQGISHRPSLNESPQWIHHYFETILRFEEHLGICFLQLPPDYGVSQMRDLYRFLLKVPPRVPLAIEFRHPSWFEGCELHGIAFKMLSSFGVGTVVTDVAGNRSVLHASLSSSRVLIRFVGNDLHPSDYLRVRTWVNRLRDWKHMGVKEVYFFVHQTHDEWAPDLLKFLIHELNEELGWGLSSWVPVESQSQLALF